MEISQVRAFLAVAREGGFSAAARRLYRTQPAITMTVQKLERELGSKLFERSGRGVRLTGAGQTLREMLGPLLEQFDSAGARLHENVAAAPAGAVRVGADEAAALYLLPGPLRALLKLYPRIEPVVRCQTRTETLADLRTGEIDFGVLSLPVVPRDLSCRPFLRSDRVLIAARSFGRVTRGPVTWEKLSTCPILLPPKGSPLHELLDRRFRQHGLSCQAVLQAGSWETLKQYAGLGLGIAVVPGFCLQRGDRRLIARPVRSLFGHDTYGIVLARNRPPSTAVRLLIERIARRSVAG